MRVLMYVKNENPKEIEIENNLKEIRKRLNAKSIYKTILEKNLEEELVAICAVDYDLVDSKANAIAVYHFKENRRKIFTNRFIVCNYKDGKLCEITKDGKKVAKSRIYPIVNEHY